MSEIILEIYKRELSNNTIDIVNLSSKITRDLDGKEIDGKIEYNLHELQDNSDVKEFISEFVKLLAKRNQLIGKLREELNKEYISNIEDIKQLNRKKKT